jgi:hypothetical protein
VVGVALLLGITVISLGALTAGIGAVVEENAARADATRVADGFARVNPTETTGRTRTELAFAEGELRAVDRQVRLFEGDTSVRTVQTDGLVFEAGDRRVAFLAGAVIRGRPGNAVLHTPPPVTASRGSGGILVVGAPTVGDPAAVSGRGGVEVALQAEVSHTRTDLGDGTYGVAIETRTPRPLRERFDQQGASVSVRDIDGDGVPSVVARFPGDRAGYLVVHRLRLEVERA